jgi:serine/threonine protein phosphatase PrpC
MHETDSPAKVDSKSSKVDHHQPGLTNLDAAVARKRPLGRSIGFSTDVGRCRDIDEDSVVAADIRSSYASYERRRIMLLVADGMGGHNAGQVASANAARVVSGQMLSILATEAEISSSMYHEAIQRAIEGANREVLGMAADEPTLEGMGTTMTLVVIDENQVHIGHIGDSRVYVLDDESIRQVTKDHSYVQTLVDQGRITAQQAKNHPDRNIVTRVVGYYDEARADVMSLSIEDNESVLVCCDGLTAHVGDEEIREIVLRSNDPQSACDELVSLANRKGGTDNISVAIASPKTSA